MRLRDPRTAHTLALYALPVVVAGLGWGAAPRCWPRSLVATGRHGAAPRRDACCGRPARRARCACTPSPSRTTSEKVRWCLDRLGVAYEEVPNVGILGVLLTGRTVPALEVPPGLTRIGDSPRILRYLWGEYAGRLPFERTAFLEPTPATLELEQFFDRRLGNDVRVWVYSRVFERRDLTLRTWGVEETRIPAWQRALLRAGRAGAALRRAPHARRDADAGGAGARAHAARPSTAWTRCSPTAAAISTGDVAQLRRHHLREPRGARRAAAGVCAAAASAAGDSPSTISTRTGEPRSRPSGRDRRVSSC